MWRNSVTGLIAVLAFLPSAHLLADDAPVVANIRDARCHMVISGQFAVFNLHVEGLVPNESISFESTSNDERVASQRQASPEGTFGSAMFVQVIGHDTGTCTVTIKASRCTLTATFPWSVNE